MTERFTSSMSDEAYEDMEADRKERGLSRSAYVEQAVRKSVKRNTKTETIIEALTQAVAITVVMAVLSLIWMIYTYVTARTIMSGDFVAAASLFATSTFLMAVLPTVIERLDARHRRQIVDKSEVEA